MSKIPSVAVAIPPATILEAIIVSAFVYFPIFAMCIKLGATLLPYSATVAPVLDAIPAKTFNPPTATDLRIVLPQLI